MPHYIGYIVWVGAVSYWHRTLIAAEIRAHRAQRHGYTVQIDCCRCGNRTEKCTCDVEVKQ